MTTTRPAVLFLVWACLFSAVACRGAQENAALGKPYRLEPAPNYPQCTESGDAVQLTDGKYVEGYFWVQPGTVGWAGRSPVVITIDLQTNQPIAGVSLSTAAGVAGVSWPSAVYLWVSDDAKTWHVTGDLVALSARNAPAPMSGYAVHRFKATELATHGRFLRLIIVPTESYVFADEIEVYRGPDALLLTPATGPVATSVPEYVAATQIDSRSRRRLAADLATVRQELTNFVGRRQVREKLNRDLDSLSLDIPGSRIQRTNNFRTIFPISPLHERVFKVQAAIWREMGFREVVAWPAQRWDMLPPTEPPQTNRVSLEVRMMRNEYRSAAFNLSNPGDEPRQVELSFSGNLPGGKAPDYVTMHEVPFTDTQSGVPVAAALPLAERRGESFVVRVPAGLTRQVWLTFHPRSVPPGDYAGSIVLKQHGSRTTEIPIRFKLYAATLPAQPTLHVGGWDYTDQDRCYQVTPENRAALIRNLREHFVDSPWAQATVLGPGKYNEAGDLVEPPDPSRSKEWVGRWRGARNYYVFVAVGEKFAGFAMGTREFTNAVSNWSNWWADETRSLGIRLEQVGLLLVDEPQAAAQDRIIIEYAKVIHAAQPKLVVWEDPIWDDPAKATPEMFGASDVLCPNLPMIIRHGKAYADFYLAQKAAGKRLWLYSCHGPGRLLDPYSYHRMQPWFCWKYGAEGAGYWAFGDSNGASCWNEYLAPVGAYTPLFLDDTSVTDGKQMEAIREGVEDYEYLRMLRDRVIALEQSGSHAETTLAARRLLDTAADRVTGVMTAESKIYWAAPKDRTVADQVRLEILDALERLGAD